MPETLTEPTPGPAPGDDVAAAPAEAKRAPRARMSRDTLFMLVVPPVLVAVVFAAFVVWRQTAEFDSTELSSLAWSTIWSLLREHVALTVASSLLVVLIAVPLGVLLTRGKLRVLSPVVVGIANIGQAAPSIGLLVLLFLWLSGNPSFTGFRIAVIGLTLYGLLPVLRNTIAGLQAVEPTMVEAGRGLGMSGPAVLFRIELPLALPVIMTGVRTALVLVVGTATLAAFINGGGLGEIVDSGITLYRFRVMVAGAVLVALLALLVEWLGRLLELAVRPKGI